MFACLCNLYHLLTSCCQLSFCLSYVGTACTAGWLWSSYSV